MHRFVWILAATLLFATVVGCQPKPPEPPLEPAPAPAPTPFPDVFGGSTPAAAADVVTYLIKQAGKAPRNAPGDEDRLNAFVKEHLGCLDANKDDECRFMLCSPHAIYAGDEYIQLGKLDDAFAFYTAAFNLLKQDLAGNMETRNKRESDFEAKEKDGSATEQDRRHYLYRRAILTQLLFRDHAEIARLMERMALVFDAQGKTDEAQNARTTSDAFIHTAAAEYAAYYNNRAQLVPMLDPNDEKFGSNYLAVVKDLDGMMLVRHF